MRRGSIALFVVVVTAISLALTASYTVNQNKNQSTQARALVEVECGSTGQACCPGSFGVGGTCNNPQLICRGGTCVSTSCSNFQKCDGSIVGAPDGGIVCGSDLKTYTCTKGSWAPGAACTCQPGGVGAPTGDEQYVGQACSPPGRGTGTCQLTVGELLCTGGNEFVAGYCPGSSSVQCCVAKQTAPPGQGGENPPQPPPGTGTAGCTGGVSCNGVGGISTAHGEFVCGMDGAGNPGVQYSCNNGAWQAAGSCACNQCQDGVVCQNNALSGGYVGKTGETVCGGGGVQYQCAKNGSGAWQAAGSCNVCSEAAPPPPVGGGAGGFVVGGLTQAIDTGERIGGATVEIGARSTATGVTTTILATSDGNGVYSAQTGLVAGDSYYVRPQGAPAGFSAPGVITNSTHSKMANTGTHTPGGAGSYEQQVVGDTDCASFPGGASCNFGYNRANATPAVKACRVKTVDPPPVVALPPEDLNATVKKDMDITIRTFLPNGPGGTAGNTSPSVTTLPMDVAVTNADNPKDSELVTVNMTWKGNGIWEGKYSTEHFPGTRYSLTIWPKKYAKKTLCHVGTVSPHIMYPTYECADDEGTIILKSGANLLDFSKVKTGAGDLNVEGVRDGHVDAQDLYQLVEYIRDPSRDDADGADLNLDGAVNQQDYDLAVWSLQNVPE